MGLTSFVGRSALRATRVLCVEGPGQWLTRVAVEREVERRGWRPALTPADADVLVVCGSAGTVYEDLVSQLWEQLPGPRAQVHVDNGRGVSPTLDAAAAVLLDADAQRDDARTRHSTPDHEGMDQEGMDHGGIDHGGMDHGGMDHGDGGMDQEGMDHGGMEPNGIPLAGGGGDRDGLEMDVLHVRLGPVLPHWPAGFVLRCSLQGDVIVHAEASHIDSQTVVSRTVRGGTVEPAFEQGRPVGSVAAARRCDDVSALLGLAGWDRAAALARRARDHHLDGDLQAAHAAVARLDGVVGRSRMLRWSLRGLARVDDQRAAELGLPPGLTGDALDRLRAALFWLTSPADDRPEGDGPSVPAEAVAQLATGLDLAAARLVVASLGLSRVERDLAVSHG